MRLQRSMTKLASSSSQQIIMVTNIFHGIKSHKLQNIRQSFESGQLIRNSRDLSRRHEDRSL